MSTELALSAVKKELMEVRPDFESLNLNNLSFIKELEFYAQALEKNPYLLKTTKESRLTALKNIALSGLSSNPIMKLCYFIPRSRSITIQGQKKKVVECLAEPSYMGLCKILTDSGSVLSVSATIVYEKEAHTLEYQDGAGGFARHKPYVGLENPGQAVACYAKAILPSGVEHTYLIRPFQWNDIMLRSESVKSYNEKKAKGEYAATPTWISDKDEMIRKTAVKNLYKYLPKTERALMVATAFEMDNQVNGINFEKEQKQPSTVSIDVLDNQDESVVSEFQSFLDKMRDGTVPNKLEGKGGQDIDVVASLDGLERQFNEGSLHKAKFDQWKKYLDSVYEKAKNG